MVVLANQLYRHIAHDDICLQHLGQGNGFGLGKDKFIFRHAGLQGAALGIAQWQSH